MLPIGVKESIDYYVDHGIPTGSFLYAVLSNDLFEAMGRADETNRHALFDIVQYIYCCCPQACKGSSKAIDDWIALHRTKPEEAQAVAQVSAESRMNWRGC